MIGALGTQFSGQQRPAAARQFLGVDPETEPGVSSRSKNATRFSNGEISDIAKHIAKLRQTLAGNARDHDVGQKPDVLLPPVAVLIRHVVRAKEGWDQFQPAPVSQLIDRFEALDFIL